MYKCGVCATAWMWRPEVEVMWSVLPYLTWLQGLPHTHGHTQTHSICICLCVTLHMVFYIWFHPPTTFCVFLSQITSVYLQGIHLCTDVNNAWHTSSVFRFQGFTFPEANASKWTEARSRDDTVDLLRNWQMLIPVAEPSPPVHSTWGLSMLGSSSVCYPASLLSLPSGYKVVSHRKTRDCQFDHVI